MKRWSILKIIAPWFILMAVISCGTTDFDLAGGGVGGTGIDLAGGGIGGTGISVGRITAFGSVWVNGVEYKTEGAIISIEGSESTSDGTIEFDSSLLDEGKIVTVHWSKDAAGNAFADRIEFEDNLEGAVTGINPPAKTVEVMGQIVKVDESTVFLLDREKYTSIVGNTDAILGALTTGNIVEVSGFAVDVDGTIHATYIELKSSVFTPGISLVEIKGVISNLMMDSMIFNIGNLTVDFKGSGFEDMTAVDLRNGLYVEVKGTLDDSGLLLTATMIEAEGDITATVQGKEIGIEIEGFVTSLVDGNGQFAVNSRPVKIISTTQFKNGASESDIILGAIIEVEGTIDDNRVLIADEIEIKSGSDDHHNDGGDSGDPS